MHAVCCEMDMFEYCNSTHVMLRACVRGHEDCVWQHTAQESPRVDEGHTSHALHESEECSSYGSDDSGGEQAMEAYMEDAVVALEGVTNARSGRKAGMEGANEAIMAKLASLEKVMATLQTDMSCVREDVGVIHGETVKIAEHLSSTRYIAEAAADAQERGPLDATTWCTWTGRGNVTPHADAEIMNNDKGKKIHARQEEANPGFAVHAAATSILQTQHPDMEGGTHINIGSSADDSGTGDWYNEQNTSPGPWSPPGKQRRTNNAEEEAEEETQNMELAVDCTQGAAAEAALSLWVDFTSIVNEVPVSDDDGDGG